MGAHATIMIPMPAFLDHKRLATQTWGENNMTNREFDQADARLRDALCRTEFASFFHRVFHWLAPGSALRMNWHIPAIAYELERVRRGIIRRLIINGPPRTLKSLMSSVAFPAFILGHDPTKRVIGVSYSSDLAIKHSND